MEKSTTDSRSDFQDVFFISLGIVGGVGVPYFGDVWGVFRVFWPSRTSAAPRSLSAPGRELRVGQGCIPCHALRHLFSVDAVTRAI